MNFRRKLTIMVPVAVIVLLAIALVALPAGAINQSPAPPGFGVVLNSPGPVPTMINYQGYLTDADGNPINDTLQMTFSIYDVPTEGVPLWTEIHASITVTDGLFNVLLGSVSPINPSHLTGESYLGLQVGSDLEMTPRQQIVSVAYAFHADEANNADTLDGKESTDFAPTAHNHDGDYVNLTGDKMKGQLLLPTDGLVVGNDQLILKNGKVGIGTTTLGAYQLWVEGDSNSGIYGIGTNYGVFGRSEGGTAGIAAYHTSGTYGRVATNNEGVYGSSTSGYGVYGSGSTGVYGSGTTIGVRGDGGSTGVRGSGTSYGVYGASSTYGVYGSGDFAGVYGLGESYGVYGLADGIGVRGSGTSCGVYGSGTGWDFYAATNNYGPFTGGHEVKLSAGFPQNFRPGMIVSTTGETQVRNDEKELNFSSTMPTVKLSDTPNDKTVFGVITSESPLLEGHWYQSNDGERFGIVNALGEGRVWVTDINGDIENGDYITTSAIAGYGQKQDDDLLHSYTLGKATETVDWSQVTDIVEYDGQKYKIYPIAIVYTSG